MVSGVTTPEEAQKSRRLDQPVVVTLTVADGRTAEAITARQHRERLFGPYQQAPQVAAASWLRSGHSEEELWTSSWSRSATPNWSVSVTATGWRSSCCPVAA